VRFQEAWHIHLQNTSTTATATQALRGITAGQRVEQGTSCIDIPAQGMQIVHQHSIRCVSKQRLKLSCRLTSSGDGRKVAANAMLCNASSLCSASVDERGDAASRACQRVPSIHLTTAADTVSTSFLHFANWDSRQLVRDVRLSDAELSDSAPSRCIARLQNLQAGTKTGGARFRFW
jgi:hypothetical protein